MADGARRTVVRSYQLDVDSETDLRIKVEELLFDNAYIRKVVDDEKSWFTLWKCLISFKTKFSSPPIAWGVRQLHSSVSNLLLLRL